MQKPILFIILLAFSTKLAAQEENYYYFPRQNSIHGFMVETSNESIRSIRKLVIDEENVSGRPQLELIWSYAQHDAFGKYSCSYRLAAGFSITNCTDDNAKHVFDNLVEEFSELQRNQSLTLLQ